MLGRSALADPWLPGKIAGELGIAPNGSAADSPAPLSEWVPLLERFAELSLPFTEGSRYTARRIKQWLRMASRGDKGWLDLVKQAETTEEILGILRTVTQNQI
jgi:hypothetical protein